MENFHDSERCFERYSNERSQYAEEYTKGYIEGFNKAIEPYVELEMNKYKPSPIYIRAIDKINNICYG